MSVIDFGAANRLVFTVGFMSNHRLEGRFKRNKYISLDIFLVSLIVQRGSISLSIR